MASLEDIGIDVGSSNILIYARNKGIVFSEPSMVAVDKYTQTVIAVGKEAYGMLGREPNNIEVKRPLQSGAIRDFNMLSFLLNHYVREVIGKRVFSRPRVVLSISSSSNELEKRELVYSMLEAGARRVQLLDRPLAAAVGGGIQVLAPNAHMVVDIGGDDTHIGVINSGHIAYQHSGVCGGDAFTNAIIRYIRLKYSFLIGLPTAEELKRAIGTVHTTGDSDVKLLIAGNNLVSGLPKQMEIKREEIAEALLEPTRDLTEGIIGVIENLSPELASDVFENGILLTGGGALLGGLSKVIQSMTNVPCRVAEQPHQCVASGCGLVLEHMQELGSLLGASRKSK